MGLGVEFLVGMLAAQALAFEYIEKFGKNIMKIMEWLFRDEWIGVAAVAKDRSDSLLEAGGFRRYLLGARVQSGFSWSNQSEVLLE